MDAAYQYKAFISYRHTAHDKAIAEKLQKKLESYKPPKGLDQKEKWKIFRDETELSSNSSLSDKIKDALRHSEFLIVICSETTKDSKWCREELEFFKSLHNGSTAQIIPLVTSGNPEEVFPPALLTTTVLDEDTGEYFERDVEPLAANVSAPTLKGSLSALNTEFLRVAAPMLYCGYDNLFLRDRRRRRRRIVTAGAAVTVAVILFTLYTLTMLMKISSQNADLEKKNNELDLSNSNLKVAYSNLDTANTKLTKINSDLDTANSKLIKSNSDLDNANSELLITNAALDNSNAELSQKKKDLENVNGELKTINSELDNSNAELQKTNTALDNSNAELLKSNTALDKSNAELQKVNTALDASNTQLQQSNEALDKSNIELQDTNEALAAAKQKAEDREKEAVSAKEIAEVRRQEAEEAMRKAIAAEEAARIAEQQARDAEEEAIEARDAEEEQRKKAEAAKKEAETARDDAEKARDDAENARLETEKKNRALMKANAEISASNADATFSYNYDRIGALKEAVSTPLYQESDSDILPATTRFLNKALYSMAVNRNPRLTLTLEAQSYIKDFRFSPEGNYIVACGVSGFVNVFDVKTGKMIYNTNETTLSGAYPIDERHVIIITSNTVSSIDFLTGEVTWSHTMKEISRINISSIRNSVLSDDRSKVALFNNDGFYAFLNTQTGETIYTYHSSSFMSGFYDNAQKDFSDGVHFSVACYQGIESEGNKYLICIDLSKERYSQIKLGDVHVDTTRNIGSNSVAVAYHTQDENNVKSELRIYNRLSSKLLKTCTLCDTALNDMEAVSSLKTEGNGAITEYVAIIGTRSNDNRSCVFFVDISNGDVITYYSDARVTQVKDPGKMDGTAEIYTEKGVVYQYNILTDEGNLSNSTFDSSLAHADGSVKLIWADSELVAALGSNKTRIVIYRLEHKLDHQVIFKDKESICQVLENDDYIVAVSSDEAYVYSKEEKSTSSIPLGFTFDDTDTAAIYQSRLILVKKSCNKLTAIALDDSGNDDIVISLGEKESTATYALFVSENEETLVAVTPSQIVRINDLETPDFFSPKYPMIRENNIRWFHKLSPDGKYMATKYIYMDNNSAGIYHEEWWSLNFETGEQSRINQEDEPVVVAKEAFITFSSDSALVAFPMSDRIVITRTDDGSVINEFPLSEEIVSAMTFTSDNEKLLVLYESGYLTEYALYSQEKPRSVTVPFDVFRRKENSNAYVDVTMQMNAVSNEILIYNKEYACFIDLSTLEVTAETFDKTIKIFSYTENSQTFIMLDDSKQLILTPHHSKEQLFETANQMVYSNAESNE